MKLVHFCAMLALACFALVASPTPAIAEPLSSVIDQTIVHAPTTEHTDLSPPMEDSRTLARLLQLADRDGGTQVDFTELVVSGFLGVVGIIGLLLTKALSFLPAGLRGIFMAWRLDQLARTAFNSWAEKRAAEIRAKGVTLDMRNEAIAAMVRYGRDKAPKFVDKELGGAAGLEDRLWSRIDEFVDELFARWVRQKDNLQKVATMPVVTPPGPTERSPSAS